MTGRNGKWVNAHAVVVLGAGDEPTGSFVAVFLHEDDAVDMAEKDYYGPYAVRPCKVRVEYTDKKGGSG